MYLAKFCNTAPLIASREIFLPGPYKKLNKLLQKSSQEYCFCDSLILCTAKCQVLTRNKRPRTRKSYIKSHAKCLTRGPEKLSKLFRKQVAGTREKGNLDDRIKRFSLVSRLCVRGECISFPPAFRDLTLRTN